MSAMEPLPALRRVDILPVNGDDAEMQFVLHDRAQIAPRALAISPAGYFVLAHLDGRHSRVDIQGAFLRRFGMLLPTAQIEHLIETLDKALFLQTERFEQAYAACRAAYAAADARDNRDRYPGADALGAELRTLLQSGRAADVPCVTGLIAPHLDYTRGAPCYAAAYATLAAAEPADRYVVLGTNHAGCSTTWVATRKDFLTPLGRVPTDRTFIDALERRLEPDGTAAELDHAAEHSVELQVHFLQVIQERRPFSIVPLLCPSPCGPDDAAAESLNALAAALAEVAGEAGGRTVFIAGADLSHVGQRFGDVDPTTPAFLAKVEASDRALLDKLVHGLAAEFLSDLRTNDNATRVCSAGCLYVLRRVLAERPCRLLCYHQAANLEQETTVTCAAGVLS